MYIVQLAGSPLAGYQGDVKGFAATRPGAGKQLDTRTPAAQAYRGTCATSAPRCSRTPTSAATR